jgi:hypothetical protein
MKYMIYLLIPIFSLLYSCGNADDNSSQNQNNNTENNKLINNTNPNENDPHIGEVIERQDAGGYSYLKIDENGNVYWIAVPLMDVEVGESIIYSRFMEMKEFKSKALNKTFESVLFVEDIQKVADENSLKTAHSNLEKKDNIDINIEPLSDGKTVAQIYENKESLKGSTVKIKGKVVKYNASIMKRNWIHIQDGTNYDGKFDLLITSNESANVGDVIIVEGQLAIDKDFGAGYFYPVVVENAKLKVD